MARGSGATEDTPGSVDRARPEHPDKPSMDERARDALPSEYNMRIPTALIGLALLTTPALAQTPVNAPVEPEVWAHLPEPVTNNAVAGIELDGRLMAYSFAGLHAGKTWRDVTADAYACDLDARTCREIDGLPDGVGRLASIAVTMRDQIYVFGGYTVAEDGSERSTPEVWRFDPASETYAHITDMPLPVDDTVALPFQDRYIYLVSGWHDTDNVDLVQVYDVEENRWFEATPFPGAPVFGHAGAVSLSGQILICGGTAVIPPEVVGGRRSFVATSDCYQAEIGQGPARLDWQEYRSPDIGAVYRGVLVEASGNAVYLIGGSDNAYNYNGIGYNGEPSEPRPSILRSGDCHPAPAWWMSRQLATHDRMDIRGVVRRGPDYFALGGMGQGQAVSDAVIRYSTDVLPTATAPCPID